MRCDRRTALAGLGAAVAPINGLSGEAAAKPQTRLILLGTAGGPRPWKKRAAPAQAIVCGGSIYVIDCGYGVARQMVLAGLPLKQLRHIFITHHHSDHDIDLGSLVDIAWTSGLVTPVDCWGPPPIGQMIENYLHYQAADIVTRVADEGKTPLRRLIRSHEFTESGPVMAAEGVRVTCAMVLHPPIKLAFAYRFDTPDRSIVISGDTRPVDALIHLATGADVLVHEAMMPNRVTESVQALPNRESLARSIISHHTSAEQAGVIASAAGVKMLVLSHLIPAEEPDVPDLEWLAAARRHYAGPIIVGRDLMEI